MAMEHLPISWDGGLIAISYLVSVFASYATLGILQLRFNSAIIVLGAFNLSISGIWSMHFIGMRAYSIPAELTFNVWWTIFSAIAAFLCTSLGLLVLTKRLLTPEHAVQHPNTVAGNVAAMKGAPHGTLLFAATLVALGVCVMHYLGMHSIESPTARPVMQWGVIVASCLIAMFAATAALYFALILPVTMAFTPLTSLVMGVAVCGMHYTGMFGITYEADTASTGSVEHKNSLADSIPYIVCGSLCITAFVQAISAHMYRSRLRKAVDTVELMASLIAKARFDDLGNVESSTPEGEFQMAEVTAMQGAFTLMKTELLRIRSYLPQSVLVQIDNSTSDDDDDDEGSILEESMKNSSVGLRSASSENTTKSAASGRASLRMGALVSGSKPLGAAKPVVVSVYNIVGFHGVAATLEMTLKHVHHSFIFAISKSVADHHGVIDSLHGDRVCASFNAVRRVANSQLHGVTAALDVAKFLASDAQVPPISVGVAGGTALCGNMGTEEMTRFNVIGAVYSNAASLERLAAKQLRAVSTASASNITKKTCPLSHRILCGSGFSSYIEQNVHYEACDLVKQGAQESVMGVLSVIGPKKSGNSDEWMYELQQAAANDPHAKMNAAYEALAGNSLDECQQLLCELSASECGEGVDEHSAESASRVISLRRGAAILASLKQGKTLLEAVDPLDGTPLKL